jgi:hypothetical protein
LSKQVEEPTDFLSELSFKAGDTQTIVYETDCSTFDWASMQVTDVTQSE